jgi:hypothetical protein
MGWTVGGSQRERREILGSHAAPAQQEKFKILPTTKTSTSTLSWTTNTCYKKAKIMIPPGLEPGTACVLDRSDNQLHHRTI